MHACVCMRGVCVWKKEAEPVNGELAGFLPLETTNSAVLLFHVDTIIDNNTAGGNRSSFTGGLADGAVPLLGFISDADCKSVK